MIRVFIGVCVAIGCYASLPTFAGTVMPMPDSWERTLGMLPWPDLDLTPREIRENARNYSFVWGAALWQADDFWVGNPDINVGFYFTGFFDPERARPDPFSEDTEQSRARTLLWWNTEADGVGHPDWVMYQCDGVTPAYALLEEPDEPDDPLIVLPNMPLDFTNPAVVEWQAREPEGMEAHVTAYSADLIALRNFNHACGVYRGGEWVQLFSGEDSDPVFTTAVLSWANQLRFLLAAHEHPKGLVINFPIYPFYSEAEIAALAASVDGILDEEGFTNFGDGRGGDDWLGKIRKMNIIQEEGMAVYSLNYTETDPVAPEEVEWILGSFLMAKGHSAYIAITKQYPPDEEWPWPHRPEYDLDIGHPCGPMTEVDGVYGREYSLGMAVVNPARVPHDVTLPTGSFTDLYGAPMPERLSLPRLSGKVLLTRASRC